MTQAETKARTKAFALRVIRLVRALPKSVEGRAIANQLIGRGPLWRQIIVRPAAQGRGRKFAAKVGVVLEEADESLLWLELIVDAGLLPAKRCDALLLEATELVSMMAATRKSAVAKSNLKSEI